MPVLSLQITLVQPRVSTLASRFTMALRLAIFDTPMANVTAVTAGNPSGMVATANATERLRSSVKPLPRMRPMTKTSATMPAERSAKLWAKPLS